MLSNAIYRGQITHKGTVYPGGHPAIIDAELWDATQHQLAANRNGERSSTTTAPSLLAGLAFDDAGNRLSPSHAKKGSRRYRYYVSAAVDRPLRMPAQDLENIVTRELAVCIADELSLHALCDDDAMLYRGILAGAKRLREALLSSQTGVRSEATRSLAQRIVVGQQAISITVLGDALGAPGRTLDRHASITLKRCGQAVRLISASTTDSPRAPDPKLIALLSRTQDWFERLATGGATALEVIAKDERVTSSWVARVIHLAFLAPDIAQAIIDGRQPPELTAERLMRLVPLPMDWRAQREHLDLHRPTTRRRLRAPPSFRERCTGDLNVPALGSTEKRAQTCPAPAPEIADRESASPRSAPIGAAQSKRARIAASPLTTWRRGCLLSAIILPSGDVR